MKYSPNINNKSSRYKMLPPFRWLKLWYSCTVSTTSTTASPPTPWWWSATPWPSWACWTGWWARRRRWRRGRRPLSICQAGGVDTVPNPGSTVTCSVSAVFCWNSPQVRGPSNGDYWTKKITIFRISNKVCLVIWMKPYKSVGDFNIMI